MPTNFSLNTFNIGPIKGLLDYKDTNSVITAQLDPAASASLQIGQAVKFLTASNGLMKVTALTANTDIACGFVSYNVKDGVIFAGRPFEMAMSGAIMYMEASAAIAVGAMLEIVYNGTTNGSVGGQVVTSGGTNPVIGVAMETATAAGQLILVKIKLAKSL